MGFLSPRPPMVTTVAQQFSGRTGTEGIPKPPSEPQPLRQPQGGRPQRQSAQASFLGPQTVANRPAGRNTLVPTSGFGSNTLLGQA